MDQHPLWYLNVVANPDVEVQIGNDVCAMRAHTADDAERAELWPKLVAMYRDYDDTRPAPTQIPFSQLSPA
jgi:deazaflavin-dependent oxidoreductase (nitroreductase family)